VKGVVPVILGPTASGKSELGYRVALTLGGEIVSADSRQIYRLMDIGTAKPPREYRRAIPHHLLDILDPDQPFNAFLYSQLARKAIDSTLQRGKVPLVVGGCGFYIRALIEGLVADLPASPPIRRRLIRIAERKGKEFLHKLLSRVDPQGAEKISPRDLIRTVRALEVWLVTHHPLSQLQSQGAYSRAEFIPLKIGLRVEKKRLYRFIGQRVEEMIGMGLVEEVRRLLDMGFSPQLGPLRSLGYKELISYLKGEIILQEAKELIKLRTRRYAKRQLTWFRGEKGVNWLDVGDGIGEAEGKVLALYREAIEIC